LKDPKWGWSAGPVLCLMISQLLARLSGMALASGAAGYVSERYWKGQTGERIIKWSRIIGCNMAFRKAVLNSIGAFDTSFWPGEENGCLIYNVFKKGFIIIFQPDAAIKHFKLSLKVRPEETKTHNALAIELAKKNKLESAILHFKEAIRLDPKFIDAQNNLGFTFFLQGEYQESHQSFSDPSKKNIRITTQQKIT